MKLSIIAKLIELLGVDKKIEEPRKKSQNREERFQHSKKDSHEVQEGFQRLEERFFQEFLAASKNDKYYQLYCNLQCYSIEVRIAFLESEFQSSNSNHNKNNIEAFLKKVQTLDLLHNLSAGKELHTNIAEEKSARPALLNANNYRGQEPTQVFIEDKRKKNLVDTKNIEGEEGRELLTCNASNPQNSSTDIKEIPAEFECTRF